MRAALFGQGSTEDKLVPYNADEETKKRGARYGLIPVASYVVVGGRLALAGPADIGGGVLEYCE